MGKISPVSTKYTIYAKITIEGSVDRPDVIGAIFGQTEGFLGQDLELRELQRSGKVGRIEVRMDSVNGKASGEIIIPCSLDKAETAIIGAALETIERIGPCNSQVKVERIEDVRVSKREFVIARAKELLSELQSSVLPDSQEITEEVAQSIRLQEITEWGPEKLPAGPEIDESEEIIVVEGRADVISLLKNGFKNAIALNGTNVPESVKGLCKEKTVTVFVDGDRGGDLIIKELMETTEIDYISKAPAGKEVEELTKKEIHIGLRARIVASQFRFESNHSRRPQYSPNSECYRKPSRDGGFSRDSRDSHRESHGNRDYHSRPTAKPQTKAVNEKMQEQFKKMLDDLVGTRGACILDKDNNILGKVPARELEATLNGLTGVFAIVLDGAVTKELAIAAERAKVGYIIGKISKLKPHETKVGIITPKDF